MNKEFEEIYNSYINGQKTQMADQINEYGLILFLEDLRYHLLSRLMIPSDKFDVFSSMVITYHKIMELKG